MEEKKKVHVEHPHYARSFCRRPLTADDERISLDEFVGLVALGASVAHVCENCKRSIENAW